MKTINVDGKGISVYPYYVEVHYQASCMNGPVVRAWVYFGGEQAYERHGPYFCSIVAPYPPKQPTTPIPYKALEDMAVAVYNAISGTDTFDLYGEWKGGIRR